jgi:hypothetical protein
MLPESASDHEQWVAIFYPILNTFEERFMGELG